MKTYKAKLRSKSGSPYSQSRHYSENDVPKTEKERPADYDQRTWKNKAHVSTDGTAFIPPMAIKNCLQDAAKFLSIQIPGKGKSTFTKHFDAGVMVVDPISLGVHVDEMQSETLYVPSDGRPGGGKRVDRTFPLFLKWEGDVLIHVLDETITTDVLHYVLEQAGLLIGIGRFRPRNRGYYGRFDLVDLQEVGSMAA